MDSEKDLKVKLAAKEKEFQEKCKEVENQSANVLGEIDTNYSFKAMSQIGLKDTELTKLKNQIKEFEETIRKDEHQKKKVDEKCQELINKNAKLNKQVVGKMALQGARHMIWDKIISETNKLRPYLDFIADQEDALEIAKKKVSIVKGELHKRLVGVAQNAVNSLSNLSEGQSSMYGIQNKVAVVSRARKVV